MKRPILYSILLVATPSACDDATQPDVEQAIAKAVHVADPDKEAREKLDAKDRAQRQERAAQQKSKEQARAAEIDAAAVLPEVVPTSLEAACDATVNAYDTFMKSGPEKDALLWYQGRRKKMAERRAACVTQANITVAACQATALVAALPTLLELERTEAANLVFGRCADKFGKT